MKRTLALLLAALPACAEDCICRLPQYAYLAETLLNPEACPEVCLMPYGEFLNLSRSSFDGVRFLCFSGPEGFGCPRGLAGATERHPSRAAREPPSPKGKARKRPSGLR